MLISAFVVIIVKAELAPASCLGKHCLNEVNGLAVCFVDGFQCCLEVSAQFRGVLSEGSWPGVVLRPRGRHDANVALGVTTGNWLSNGPFGSCLGAAGGPDFRNFVLAGDDVFFI